MIFQIYFERLALQFQKPILVLLLSVVPYILREVGTWLYASREAYEFAVHARKYNLVGRCIENLDSNLYSYWNFLVGYQSSRSLRRHLAMPAYHGWRKCLWPVRHIRRVFAINLLGRALMRSHSIVESVLVQYVACRASKSAIASLQKSATRWRMWRSVNTVLIFAPICLSILGGILGSMRQLARNPVVAVLPSIAWVLSIAFLLFGWLSFHNVYKSNCRQLLSLVSVLYRDELFKNR